MRIISNGNLYQQINIDTSDEFGMMADSFNQMAKSLRESKDELKKTYEELAQKHKLAALGELSARVAHEIKNPLGIIKGSAQIMLDTNSSQEIKREVGRYIIEEINRLNAKVMNILDYARPKVMSLEPCSINDVIEKTLQFWEARQLSGKGIRIVKKLHPSLPDIKVDPERIRQAFLNLLINAYEAIGDYGELTISTTHDGDRWVRIIFRDTGEGISEENLGKIFEPFFTTKKDGTGLGLPTVRQIIESHRGKINVQSEIGVGTGVEIFLPLN